jgi:transposase-like protein
MLPGKLSLMKTEERLEARRIRREEGASMKQIARRLGVSVSSVSLWVRDVELSPDQQAALRNKVSGGWSANARAARRRRRESQEHGRRLVEGTDPLFLAGCMLFWAEGSKERNSVVFVNADPEMIAFFKRVLTTTFGVPDSKFRVACNLFADHAARQAEIEDFWLEKLQLPRSCLRRSTVNAYSRHSQKNRRNRLPYGTCRLVVCDTAVAQAIYGAIQEYAGFDRPEWLD